MGFARPWMLSPVLHDLLVRRGWHRRNLSRVSSASYHQPKARPVGAADVLAGCRRCILLQLETSPRCVAADLTERRSPARNIPTLAQKIVIFIAASYL